jgi:Tfp pilus assembly protein PilN
MLIFHTSLGIDFRENHLILTLLKRSLGRIRLVDYRIYPLWSEGEKEVREAQWISLITTFISKHQINRERVSISIPREKVVVRFIRLPLATKENLGKVLEYEAPKFTPFDKEEIYFDYQILKEENEWLNVIAVFVQKAVLESYLKLLKKMSIQPLSVQIPAVGALNLFYYHKGEKRQEISVLLDLSDPFLEMNLVQGRDWKESFHLPLPSEKKEEKILQIFNRTGLNGDGVPPPTFFVYGLDMAESTLPAFEETKPAKEISPPPLDRIEVGKNESRPDYIYASIGLPLKGLTGTPVEINLLPSAMRRKVTQIGKPLFMVLTLLAAILSFTWGVGVYIGYRHTLEALRAEAKKRKPEVESIESLQKQRGDLAQEVTEYEKITKGEFSKIEILKELAQILPSSVWIWNIRYSAGEVEMSGFADSASDLIPLLDRSPLFEKVEFLAPVTKERERRIGSEKEKERFKIKMKLEERRAGT